jgi:hypothetical protein
MSWWGVGMIEVVGCGEGQGRGYSVQALEGEDGLRNEGWREH